MLTAQGYIQDVQEHFATIFVPLDRTYLISKQEITTCEVRFDDGRTIRPEQRKKAYALINDIAAYTGHCQEELKEHFKYDLMAKTGCAHFSLSDCSVSIAREYISNMIDFCFQWDVPANDTRLNQTDDLGRYLYACLYYRKCAVCNKKQRFIIVKVPVLAWVLTGIKLITLAEVQLRCAGRIIWRHTRKNRRFLKNIICLESDWINNY